MADEKKPDTSNYVEHLRLAHLTLILTCVISIIAVWSREPSSAGRALVQLNALVQLRDNWKEGQWVRKFTGIEKSLFGEADGLVDGRASGHFRFVSFVRCLRSDGTPVLRDGKDLFDPKLAAVDFSDVQHARAIFDALKDVAQIVKPTEVYDGWGIRGDPDHPEFYAVQLNKGDPVKLTSVSAVSGSYSGSQLNWFLREDFRQGPVATLIEGKDDKSYFMEFGYPIVMPRPNGEFRRMMRGFVFPASVEKTDVNLLKGLKDTPELRALPLGNFDTSFPDLAIRTKYMSTVSLENLQDQFKEESVKSEDKVDLSFLKFPADELTYVGTGLMLALAFYVSAVLRDFRYRVSPGDKAWNVAWIGISREPTSVAIFWLSFVLPCLTALYLTDRAANLSEATKMWVSGGLVFGFGLVVASTFCSWLALQESPRDPPTPEPMVT
jgi:hypothetical protein